MRKPFFILILILSLCVSMLAVMACDSDDDDDDDDLPDDDDDDDDDDDYEGECDDELEALNVCVEAGGSDLEELIDCYLNEFGDYLDCLVDNGYGDAPWVTCLQDCHQDLTECVETDDDQTCYEDFLNCWDDCPDIPQPDDDDDDM